MIMPVRIVATGKAQIPVIDLALFLAGDGKHRVAQEIRQACESTGFFYITGHGIERHEVEAVFAASRRFFTLPLEERLKVRLIIGKNRGYQPLGSRMYSDQADAPDLNESFTIRSPDAHLGRSQPQ